MRKILWIPWFVFTWAMFYAYFAKTIFEKVESSCLNAARWAMRAGNLAGEADWEVDRDPHGLRGPSSPLTN